MYSKNKLDNFFDKFINELSVYCYNFRYTTFSHANAKTISDLSALEKINYFLYRLSIVSVRKHERTLSWSIFSSNDNVKLTLCDYQYSITVSNTVGQMFLLLKKEISELIKQAIDKYEASDNKLKGNHSSIEPIVDAAFNLFKDKVDSLVKQITLFWNKNREKREKKYSGKESDKSKAGLYQELDNIFKLGLVTVDTITQFRGTVKMRVLYTRRQSHTRCRSSGVEDGRIDAKGLTFGK